MTTHSMLKIEINRGSPDMTLFAIKGQMQLLSALTRGERKDAIELDEDAANALADLTGAIAIALDEIMEVDRDRQVRDAHLRQSGIAHLRKIGLAPLEPCDMEDVIEAFGAFVDGLPEAGGALAAPRLTEPALPPAAATRRRAG